MPERGGDYDVVFVGSGINSLVGAALLAADGWSVAVVERADALGGAVRTAELFPGFRHDLFATSHALFVGSDSYRRLRPWLDEAGVTYVRGDVPAATVFPSGDGILLRTDRDANAREFERLAGGDGEAWVRSIDELERHGDLFTRLFATELAGVDAYRLLLAAWRRLGARGIVELAGRMLTTARDLLETTYRSPLVRGLIAPWTLHAGVGPDAAASGFMAELLVHSLQANGTPMPVGGGAQLVDALASIVTGSSGACLTGVDVEAVEVRRGRAVGVRAVDGGVVTARRAVVANVTPRQLYERLLRDVALPAAVQDAARRHRYGRARMQIHVALRERPRWSAGDRLLEAATVHLSPGLDGVSRAVNEAERGLLPADPTVTIAQPLAVDPSRAPSGGWILGVQLHEVPRKPRGDAAGTIETGDGTWTPELAAAFATRALARIRSHVPNLDDGLVGYTVVSPADMAETNVNFVDGDAASGACSIDQSLFWRPAPGLAGHRTPVRGLYHIGASTHPGPGLGGASGAIVAARLRRRRRR